MRVSFTSSASARMGEAASNLPARYAVLNELLPMLLVTYPSITRECA